MAQLGADGIHHCAVPCDHFVKMAVPIDRPFPWIARPVDIAAIRDLDPALAQRLRQSGNAQRRRTHQRAAISGANIGRRADK